MRTKGFRLDQVARIWASQSQYEAFSNHERTSCEGVFYYSYSTIIGVWHPEACLLTSKRYSVSSEAHTNDAIWAAHRAGKKSFRVPFPAEPKRFDNVLHLKGNYDAAVAWLHNRRVPHALHEYHLGAPRRCASILADYCRAFDLESPHVDPEGDVAYILASRAEKLLAYNSPAQVERRLRAKAKRDLRRLLDE